MNHEKINYCVGIFRFHGYFGGLNGGYAISWIRIHIL